jgi:hypothetical protein
MPLLATLLSTGLNASRTIQTAKKASIIRTVRTAKKRRCALCELPKSGTALRTTRINAFCNLRLRAATFILVLTLCLLASGKHSQTRHLRHIPGM